MKNWGTTKVEENAHLLITNAAYNWVLDTATKPLLSYYIIYQYINCMRWYCFCLFLCMVRYLGKTLFSAEILATSSKEQWVKSQNKLIFFPHNSRISQELQGRAEKNKIERMKSSGQSFCLWTVVNKNDQQDLMPLVIKKFKETNYWCQRVGDSLQFHKFE